jgi:hypothetical protein
MSCTLCLRVLEVILIAVVITFAVAAATYVNQKPPPKPKKLTEEKAQPAWMDCVAGGANGCLTYLTFNWRAMQSGFLDLLDRLDSSCKMLQDAPRCSKMFQDVLVIVGCCWMLLDAVGVEIQASAGRPEKVDVAVFVFQLQSPDPRQLTSLR